MRKFCQFYILENNAEKKGIVLGILDKKQQVNQALFIPLKFFQNFP